MFDALDARQALEDGQLVAQPPGRAGPARLLRDVAARAIRTLHASNARPLTFEEQLTCHTVTIGTVLGDLKSRSQHQEPRGSDTGAMMTSQHTLRFDLNGTPREMTVPAMSA